MIGLKECKFSIFFFAVLLLKNLLSFSFSDLIAGVIQTVVTASSGPGKSIPKCSLEIVYPKSMVSFKNQPETNLKPILKRSHT